jgi:hypothetical protein
MSQATEFLRAGRNIMKLLPKARNSEIIIRELESELLVYDATAHRAYQLNKTLMIIYQACNGVMSFNELQRNHKYTDDLIDFALDELHANNLLEGERANHFAGLSRRDVIKKVGLASMIGLPIITGITAPRAVNAASNNCPVAGQNCTFNNYQQSNCCTTNLRCATNFRNENVCQTCLAPNSAYAADPSQTPSVEYCNAQLEKNLCCVSRGNARLDGSNCLCPVPL